MSISRILVATDFSPEAEGAVQHAATVAKRVNAEILLVHCHHAPIIPTSTPFPIGTESLYAEQQLEIRKTSEEALNKALTGYQEAGLPVISAEQCDAPPADGILDTAKRCKANLIVVGTHGRRGLKRIFLGSVAETVLRRSTCDVLVARGPAPKGNSYQRVLAPLDFSQHSEAVLARAMELMDRDGIVDMLHCWMMGANPDAYWGSVGQTIRDAVQEDFNTTAEKLMDSFPLLRKRTALIVEETSPRHGILDQLDKAEYDLIVMGSHGHTGLNRVLLGSVAESTVRHASIPVYIVRSPLPPVL